MHQFYLFLENICCTYSNINRHCTQYGGRFPRLSLSKFFTENCSLPEEVTHIIEASWKSSTRQRYQAHMWKSLQYFLQRNINPNQADFKISRKNPYFSSPGISWKAEKNQVNICFFCRKKELIFHRPKFQNKTFSVISKYHLPINVLAQKTGFPISEMLKARNCQQLVTMIFPSTFWLKKGRTFHLQKIENKNFLVISSNGIPW